MALNVRELAINVTSSGTWVQMQEDGVNYQVPTGYRATIVNLTAVNLDTDSVVVDFAISTDGTITDVERVGYPITLPTSSPYAEIDTKRGMSAGKRLYVRATGTTPNTTFRALIVERSP